MLAEGIEALKDLAVAGQHPTIIGVDSNDPTRAHVWLPSKQHLLEVPRKPAGRGHVTLTIDSFAEAVERYAEDSHLAAVWVTTTNIVLVIDDTEYRANRVSLPIQPSPIFKSLREVGGRKFDQKGLLKFLRHDLQSAALPESLLLTVASLKWETNDTETGGVSTTKNAMGRSINSEVKGEGELPDSFTLTFTPFPAINGFSDRVEVTCSLFFDPVERQIEVIPQPGQLDLATAKALEQLAEFVEKAMDDGPAVFCGTP